MPARQTLRAWAMPSSRGTTVYETVLYTEGSTSCDCPAWVFHRKGGERTCKHIRQLAREIPIPWRPRPLCGLLRPLRGSG
ncbi:MAG: hypothetical protein M3361_14130 [Candidatus Tectomicrobia bacterium]|nr:hypothetical protein [Candidatus Tectomicrobia bacterium]